MEVKSSFPPDWAPPADWPGEGPIDLDVHDLPHRSSTTEWWYTNAHLTTESGRRFGVFAAFFRKVRAYDPQTNEPLYMYSLAWGISNPDTGRYEPFSGLDSSAPGEALRIIERGLASDDSRWNDALSEILRKGNLPSPDHIFDGEVYVNEQKLELEYAEDTFRKREDGSYELHLFNERTGVGCDLVFEPRKPPIRQGTDGVVRGTEDERMFYYFIPRNRVTGSVVFDARREEVTHGQGWYDHEFGIGEVFTEDPEIEALPEEQRKQRQAERRERRKKSAVGWNWLSVQFEDGSDLSVYSLSYTLGGGSAGDYAVFSDPEGRRTHFTELTFEPQSTWQSTQTFITYPTSYRVRIPEAEIDLQVDATFADQEFITLMTKLSFWEGQVRIRGTVHGKPQQGIGFVERAGYGAFEKLDDFFEAVGRVVRKRVDMVLPHHPDYETAVGLIASKAREYYARDVDLEQFGRTFVAPLREIVDRGGKGWRSYALIACCDLVGGDSRNFIDWLAYPELMHVGSLIIDDVQDKSEWRRGGKAAHMIYGEGQAINSGTAGYFVWSGKMLPESLSKADKLRVYEYYFESLRAGHAGQAIDLDGFYDMLQGVVETGDSDALERKVLAVHRLKTAAPAGCLARIGGVFGAGTDVQTEQLGLYFEAVGLAFQMIDDVLNLRGFKKELKTRAEDITHGKVTLPVAKALSGARLDHTDRKWLVETVQSHPTDFETLDKTVDLIEKCGANQAVVDEAHELVEVAWRNLEPVVEDSLTKVMTRAFSWYLLQRHY